MKILSQSATKFITGIFSAAVLLLSLASTNALAEAPISGAQWRVLNSSQSSNYPSAQAAAAAYMGAAQGRAQVSLTLTNNTNYALVWTSNGQTYSNTVSAVVLPVCPAGTTYDPARPSGDECGPTQTGPVPTQCAGSPSPEIRATNSWAAMQNPVCTWDTPEHLNATCSGTFPNGRPVTTGFWCNGPIGNQTDGPIPDEIPNPPPPVKVSFPDCPVGTYAYTDLDNVTTCSVNTYNASPQPCASGNAGSVNGQLVCLPANPAPATAANERVNAQNKANEAKASPGSPEAVQAAKDAAVSAQKAKDASDSLPTSSDAASDAQKAIASAKQAAAYAGQPYNGPQPSSNTGTGGGGTSPEDTGPKECGSPGKPKCQIDETGTPTDGTTAFTAANTALDAAVATYTDSLSTITSDTDKDASWGWLPSLPQGSCTPIQFAALGEVNWCDSAASIEEVMTFMWSFITVFCLLGMVARAIKGT